MFTSECADQNYRPNINMISGLFSFLLTLSACGGGGGADDFPNNAVSASSANTESPMSTGIVQPVEIPVTLDTSSEMRGQQDTPETAQITPLPISDALVVAATKLIEPEAQKIIGIDGRVTTLFRLFDTIREVPSFSQISADFEVFESKPPYFIETKNGPRRVQLGIYGTSDDILRRHDFIAPFINESTGKSNALTIQTPIFDGVSITYQNLSDASSPRLENTIAGNRVSFDGKELKIGYHAGDPPSSEKLRVMINSWPIPTRKKLLWDLSFKPGDTSNLKPWPATKATISPTLIWQLKADPGFPSMGAFIDTSSLNVDRIQLTFFQRLNNRWENEFRWVVQDLPRDKFINMTVEATLDDSDDPLNLGTLKVWVNGTLIADRTGRNLIQNLTDVHRWAFGVYLTSEAHPIDENRVTSWRRARMLIAR